MTSIREISVDSAPKRTKLLPIVWHNLQLTRCNTQSSEATTPTQRNRKIQIPLETAALCHLRSLALERASRHARDPPSRAQALLLPCPMSPTPRFSGFRSHSYSPPAVISCDVAWLGLAGHIFASCQVRNVFFFTVPSFSFMLIHFLFTFVTWFSCVGLIRTHSLLTNRLRSSKFWFPSIY